MTHFANMGARTAGMILAVALIFTACQTMPEQELQGVVSRDHWTEIDLQHGMSVEIEYNYKGVVLNAVGMPSDPVPKNIRELAVWIDVLDKKAPDLLEWVRGQGVKFSSHYQIFGPAGFYHIDSNTIDVNLSHLSRLYRMGIMRHEIEHARHHLLLLNDVSPKMLPSGNYLSALLSEILAYRSERAGGPNWSPDHALAKEWFDLTENRGRLAHYYLGLLSDVYSTGFSTEDFIPLNTVVGEMLTISNRDRHGKPIVAPNRGEAVSPDDIINAILLSVPPDIRARMIEADRKALGESAGELSRFAPYYFTPNAERRRVYNNFMNLARDHPR